MSRGVGGNGAAAFRKFRGASEAERQAISDYEPGDRSNHRTSPPGKITRAKSQRAGAIEPAGDDVLRGNHQEHGAGLRAENSRRGRLAAEHRGTNDVPTFRRVRFGGGGVSHDEARGAFELRAFLWHGRAGWGIFPVRGERPGAQAGAVSISREALPRAV